MECRWIVDGQSYRQVDIREFVEARINDSGIRRYMVAVAWGRKNSCVYIEIGRICQLLFQRLFTVFR